MNFYHWMWSFGFLFWLQSQLLTWPIEFNWMLLKGEDKKSHNKTSSGKNDNNGWKCIKKKRRKNFDSQKYYIWSSCINEWIKWPKCTLTWPFVTPRVGGNGSLVPSIYPFYDTFIFILIKTHSIFLSHLI